MPNLTNSSRIANPLQERLDNIPLSLTHWFIWAMCTIGLIFDSLDLYLISFAMPMILKEWGISMQTAGWVVSASMWGMLIGAYLWGILADRIGRRYSMQGTILIYGLVTGICALVWNTMSLFWGRFIVGVGLGGLIPVDVAVQAEFIPAKYRGRLMAASVVLWPLGGLVGAWVALRLASAYGWRVLFVVGALPALMFFFVRRLVPESARFLQSRGRHQEAFEVVLGLEKKAGINDSKRFTMDTSLNHRDFEEKPVSLTELFRAKYIKRTILTWGIWFAQAFPYYAVGLWLPTLMTKYYGIPQASALKIMMGITVIGIIGRAVGMVFVDSWGRRPVMISFGILAGLSILLYTQVQTANSLLVVASLAAFFYEGIWAAIAPYTAELYPTRMRTTAAGAATAAGRWAAAIGPIFVGYALATSLNILFYIFAGSFFALALLVTTLGMETKKKSLEEISQ